MSYREYERWTNRYCKRGFRIKIYRIEFYILQQDGPYEVETTEICCGDCEQESLGA